ncbi:MAG: hypothetical protein ACE5HB_07275 [Terriglobia bacterium]
MPTLPQVRAKVGARRDTIEVSRDITVLMRTAILSFRGLLRAARSELLASAAAAFESRQSALAGFGVLAGAPTARRIEELALLLAAAEVAGRLRTRRLAGEETDELDPRVGEFAETFPRNIPPERAIAYIRSLPVVERERWLAFVRRHQRQAFTLAGVEQRQALESLRNLVARSLEQGLTAEQFNRQAADLLRNFEVTGGRLRTLWNDTVGDALRQGRQAELDDPAIRAVLGFQLFDALIDGVVRPNHAAMENTIARVEWWQDAGR